MDRYFVCHAGDADDPNEESGFIGRVYVWRSEYFRSPEETRDSDRDPIMKLYPLWGSQIEVQGDIGCYTEVFFEHPPK